MSQDCRALVSGVERGWPRAMWNRAGEEAIVESFGTNGTGIFFFFSRKEEIIVWNSGERTTYMAPNLEDYEKED